jgi:deoxyribodipyrimidine photo-lyase
MRPKVAVFWFRRDLRIEDNRALFEALQSPHPVLPVFIFDKQILSHLDVNDARVSFIHQELTGINTRFQHHGSSLSTYFGTPEEAWTEIIQDYEVQSVFFNRDYEPTARERDKQIIQLLERNGIAFKTYKDHVIFEKNEIVKDDKKPYTVFTPYSKKWKTLLTSDLLKHYPSEKHLSHLHQQPARSLHTLMDLGFTPVVLNIPSKAIPENIVNTYHQTRDYPYLEGTSRMSVHLRFGTVSIRTIVSHALTHNETWLNELIWREFYHMILYQFPSSATESFKPQYDRIPWRNNEIHFKHWCEGKTGYPLVDAGMRELNQTGHMHNRVRMVVASFLTKHLLIDWRWGERYFASKLMDFDLASNVGGWQWAAGSGCDAAPYFRVFNPTSQQEKFDPEFKYIQRWVPEYGSSTYPKPIVEHAQARVECLEVYKHALAQ